MDIRQLKYFIAVAEERNISRAAARLHISQPPLTRHIQTLEEDLGVKLFRRTNWGVELTQAGESLLSHARCIKEHVELAAEQARLASTGQVGRIDVGAYGSSMLGIVPRILDSFQRAYPQVRVVLHYAPRTSLLEGLMDRRLMLVFERYMQETQDLQVEPVCTEPLMVALNRRHPLAERDVIKLSDLDGEPMIGGQASAISSLTHSQFLQHGISPIVAQTVPDMIAGVMMVAAGLGTTLCTRSMLDMRLPNVVYRPLDASANIQVSLQCAYRKDDESPLLRALLESVEVFRSLSTAVGSDFIHQEFGQAAF